MKCPRCKQPALIYTEHDEETTIEEAARGEKRFIDGLPEPIECPNCFSQPAEYLATDKKKRDHFFCSNCFTPFTIDDTENERNEDER
jgi:hypothetical protein